LVFGVHRVDVWIQDKIEEEGVLSDDYSAIAGSRQAACLTADRPPPSLVVLSRQDTQLLACHGQAGAGKPGELGRVHLSQYHRRSHLLSFSCSPPVSSPPRRNWPPPLQLSAIARAPRLA